MTQTSQNSPLPCLSPSTGSSRSTGADQATGPGGSPGPDRTTRSMQRWLEPTDLERRLEAHLLIARKLRA